MKSALLTLATSCILLLLANPAVAQCPPDGNVELYTQADIDFFVANYPNCTVVNGFLAIGRWPNNVLDITDLTGLDFITQVNGRLSIHNNPNLTSLSGLQNITSVGSLLVDNNQQLTALNGLDGLTSAGQIEIKVSDVLTSVSALSGITSTNSIFLFTLNALTDLTGLHNLQTIAGELRIDQVHQLTDLSAFSNLSAMGSLRLSSNSALTDISNLNNAAINGSVQINNNSQLSACNIAPICNKLPGTSVSVECNANGCNTLLELEGSCNIPPGSNCPSGTIQLLSQADVDAFVANYSHCSVLDGTLQISFFTNSCTANDITDLSGLSFLTEITGGLKIHYNPLLTSLNGLQNITSVGSLLVDNNQQLTSLDGLDGLTSAGQIEIKVSDVLTSIAALDGITSTNSVFLFSLNALTDLTGLQSLTSISGQLRVDQVGQLASLSAFNNLQSLGNLQLSYNNDLTDISGLANAAISGSVQINNNSQLSACNITPICNKLPGTSVSVECNANGCNTLLELEGSCGIPPGSNCPSGTIQLLSQADVDAFVANYNHCSVLDGTLRISFFTNSCAANDITDLSGLSFLTEITGGLRIHYNPLLTSLNGLQNITSVGSLLVDNNQQLTSLDGLDGLTSAGKIEIKVSDVLTSISALSGITSTNSVFLFTLNALTDLNGLHNLQTIAGELRIDQVHQLTDLSAFSNLFTLGSLRLSFNSSLVDISDMEPCNFGSSLQINNNTNLSACNTPFVCEINADPNISASISFNATNCNTPLEVEQACAGVPPPVSACCPGPILYVNASATGGQQNGSSWSDAFLHPQDALDLVQSGTCTAGTEIWIAVGTYTPTKNKSGIASGGRDRTFFISNDVRIYGGFLGTETQISERLAENYLQTRLSGDFNGDDSFVDGPDFPDVVYTADGGENAYTVVWLEHLSTDFVLDGLTIMGGYSDGTSGEDRVGGGMYNDGRGGSSNPTLNHCTFFGNYALSDGSGIYNVGRSLGQANMRISYCKFYRNVGDGFGTLTNIASNNGAASPIVDQCLFKNNENNGGGAVYNLASNVASASGRFKYCIFEGNHGTSFGGAIINKTGEAEADTKPVFTNCLFVNNSTDGEGGAIYNFKEFFLWGLPDFTFCEPTFNFCTIADNTAEAGAGIYNQFADQTLRNCILWGNTDAHPTSDFQISGFGFETFENCIIQGGHISSSSVLESDPQFVDPANADYRLLACSPAIDRADDPTTPVADDLEGTSRPINGSFDLGAYEYDGSPCNTSVIYVNKDASGNNDGTSWADAFTDLQEAIEAAQTENKEEIWIAKGVYYPSKKLNWAVLSKPTNRDNVFYINFDVKVYGGFPNTGNPGFDNRDWDAHPTVISGDLRRDNNNVDGNFINEQFSDYSGTNAYRVLRLKDVTTDCLIDGLIITAGRTGMNLDAGNSSGSFASPTVRNCLFSGNYFEGLLIVASNEGLSKAVIESSMFRGNSDWGLGGGIYAGYSNSNSFLTISGCKFHGNRALLGGGFYTRFGAQVINCEFYNNFASIHGGAIRAFEPNANVKIINATFFNNVAGGSGGAVHAVKEGMVQVYNSIYWQNSANIPEEDDNGTNSGGNITLSNCLTGTDPKFVDEASPDLRVQGTSDAINAGDNAILMTYNVTEDILGNPRIYNGTVDMGAYENDGTYLAPLGPEELVQEPIEDQTKIAEPIDVQLPQIRLRSILGGTIYVKKDATGANDGSSWQNAFTGLQDAINAAAPGAEIWVAGGLYVPTEDGLGNLLLDPDPDRTFYIDKDIAIYGGFTGTETSASERMPALNPTILSGDLEGDDDDIDGNQIAEDIEDIKGNNSNHVVYLDGVTAAFRLDGFIITAGAAVGEESPAAGGGGLVIDGSGSGNSCNPGLQQCIFSGNYASGSGGAIFCYGDEGGSVSPTIEACTFNGNEAFSGGAIASSGKTAGNAAPSLTDCHFTGNRAYLGGALLNTGVANPVISHCFFEENRAEGAGGAVANDGGHATYDVGGTFEFCRFRGNSADDIGGAVFNTGEEGLVRSAFTNCLFSGNFALNYGGGVYNVGRDGTCTPVFTQCTFAGGSALRGGGGLANLYTNPTILNSVFWGNNHDMLSSASFVIMDYNIFENSSEFSGANAINADPQFVSLPDHNLAPSTTGDARLESCSPAINAGDNSAANIPATDLDGNPRIVNSTVDLGAYEYQLGPYQSAALATNHQSFTLLQDQVTNYSDACANLVATVAQNGAYSISGMVTAQVWIESSVPSDNDIPFVARHYELAPEENAATAHGRVTLYFTQAEFEAFNNHPNSILDLPTGPADAAGKANLLIRKIAGTSADGTGLPGTYSGTGVIIDPPDDDVVWNTDLNRWEVSFATDGFSGFFVQTENPGLDFQVAFSITVLLQSAYEEIQNEMRDLLRGLSDFPQTEPYSSLGYVVSENQGVAMNNLLLIDQSDANENVVDWMYVKLLDLNNQMVASKAALLRKDGIIIAPDGGPLTFSIPAGEYRILVKHRNHLGIMMDISVEIPVED